MKKHFTKPIRHLPSLPPEDAALAVGLSIGLALAVHELFLVLALLIVLVEAVHWTAEQAQECLSQLHLGPGYT